jgi:DNA-binding HxlR family transcriptional regulator
MLGKDYDGQECALASTLEVLGERWTLLIVRDAFFGVQRFSDFVARLDIPRAVLSERLRGLVANGIMVKREDPRRAGGHVYELTPVGEELWPVLHAMLMWGAKHLRQSVNEFRHAKCATELSAGAFCAKCGVVPQPRDVLRAPRNSRPRGRTDPVSLALRDPSPLLQPVEVQAAAVAAARRRTLVHAGA